MSMALQTGMLDGSVLPLFLSYSYSLYDVAPNCLQLPTGYWVGNQITINSDLFNSFPENIQQIFLEVGKEATGYQVKLYVEEEAKQIEDMKAKGVTFYTLSEAEKLEWAKKLGNVPERWAIDAEARGLPGKEIMNRYLELIEQSGWKFPAKWSDLPVPEF